MSLPPYPGQRDALRATLGVVALFGMGLFVAALVGVIAGTDAQGVRSAGAFRAQLVTQALLFAGGSFLLIEGLRLAHRPRERDPLTSATEEPPPPVDAAVLLVAGLTAAVGAWLAGPLIGELMPNARDRAVPVDSLGLSTGLGPDLGAILVIVGIVPLAEELLFRGVLAGAWLRAGRPGMAVVISSGLFALAHVTVGGRTVFVTLLLGLLFCGALIVARNLGAPVLAHAITNALALAGAGLQSAPLVVAMVAIVVAATALATWLSAVAVFLPQPGTLEP